MKFGALPKHFMHLLLLGPDCKGSCIDEFGNGFRNGDVKECEDGCNTCKCEAGTLTRTTHKCCKFEDLDRLMREGESVKCQVKNMKGCCTCNMSGNITESLNILPCVKGKMF